MKIVIAAWHLKDFNVGLGRYTRNLIEGIGRVDQENQYDILLPVNNDLFKPLPNFRYRVIRFPILKRRFWEQVAPEWVRQYDLLHFPYDSCVANKRGKFVVTIHDAKPQLFPRDKNTFDWKQWLKKKIIPNPDQQIDHIVTVSECSRRDLIEQLGISQERITVVYQGVDAVRFHPKTSIDSTPGVPSPYILSVAGADPTKNVKTLVAAFSMLPPGIQKHYHLVLVGDLRRRDEIRQLVQQKGLESQTHYTGIVSDAQLVRFYQHASVFVFPSLYEGFGLPVLEAMACGCPVVASDRSSLPEVVGNAGLLIDPLDALAMAKAIERVLSDANLDSQLRTAGLRRAQQFSWDRTARETVELYKKVVHA